MEIYLVYHCPCYDGIFSLLIVCIFFKFFLMKNHFSILYSLILSDLLKSQNQDMELEEEKIENNIKELDFDVFQISKNIKFFPIKPTPNSEKFSEFIKYLKKSSETEKIVIILDYYCETEENIILLSKLCSKLLIIDHHESFLKFDISEKKNLDVFFDLKKSGASLTYEYFINLIGKKYLPEILIKKLEEFIIYIEDHDLRANKYEKTEALISGLYKMQYELNVLKNSQVINKILQFDIETYIKIGIPIYEERKIFVNNYIKTVSKLIKIPINSIKTVVCYITKIKDSSIINDLAELLAEKSVSQGYDNMGIVYKDTNNSQLFKVSMRGSNKYGECYCLEVAKCFNGGGHKYAAGCFISKKKLLKYN